jgi:hypothetical protein
MGVVLYTKRGDRGTFLKPGADRDDDNNDEGVVVVTRGN